MYLVRSGAADQLEKLVLELGQNPIKIIQQAGLSQAQFRDPNTYIAYPRLAALLQLAAQQCQQPLFGIILAQRQTLHALGDLPMLVSRTTSVADTLDKVNEYLYLHASGVTLTVKHRREQVQLTLSINIDSPLGIEQLMQLSVSQLALFVAGLLDVAPNSIPLYLSQSNTISSTAGGTTGLPRIHFGATFNGIQIKASQLTSRNHQNEDAINRHLLSHLQQLQNRYPNNLTAQTTDLIRHLLSTGECTIVRVANALGLHQRTLQSRLKQQDHSYRQLLQEVRQQLAQQQLRYGTQTITELALQLGYADVAAFSRHFRLWTGQSPRQWRQYHKDVT